MEAGGIEAPALSGGTAETLCLQGFAHIQGDIR